MAQSLNNLAVLYDTQRQYTRAGPLYRMSLSISEKALGPDHPTIASSLLNYAAVLRELDRAAEAEAMEVRAKLIQAKH